MTVGRVGTSRVAALRRPRTTFDYCVAGAIGLHVGADVFALWIAYHAAILAEYAAIRLCMLPLVALMLLIYMKARR